MCRNNEHGGRKCPSQTDPEKIKERNAYRRQKYCSEKGKLVTEKNPPTKPEEPQKTVDYYAEKIFGNKNYRQYNPHTTHAISEKFVQSLQLDQRRALEEYSEMDSDHTNRYLYSPDFKNAIDNELDHKIHYRNTPEYKKLLRTQIPQRIEKIDAAIKDHKLAEPTIVYSGKGIAIPEDKTPIEHIQELHKIGETYSRPSYTSTSTNPAVASFFTDSNGATDVPIVYEYLTTEGAPLRKLSALSVEDEVLLPRDKKFTIVGVKNEIKFDVAIVGEDDSIRQVQEPLNVIVVQLVEQ
jgi:hypothetical protein